MCVAIFLVLLAGLAAFLYWRWREATVVLPKAPDRSWKRRPSPGQIWWADVPFEDSPGSKVRPCVVIRTHRDYVEVLKITSQDKSHRWDHIEMETASWDPRAQYNSFLDVSSPYSLWDDAFKRRAGICDTATWQHVTQRHNTGWVVKRRELA